jgi:putative lipoic acid-binding regulatory protein
MGRKQAGFRELVISLVESRAGPMEDRRVSERESRDGNFIALTLLLRVESQAQLDDVYRALSAHEQVLMVL